MDYKKEIENLEKVYFRYEDEFNLLDVQISEVYDEFKKNDSEGILGLELLDKAERQMHVEKQMTAIYKKISFYQSMVKRDWVSGECEIGERIFEVKTTTALRFPSAEDKPIHLTCRR